MKADKKTSKIKSLIISIVAAILIWAAITYINPPQITTTIYNLPVRFTGEGELKERGLTVVDKNGITGLSVTVEGRRDTLLSLSGGIFVEVDVSSVTAEGEYELTGNVTLPAQGLSIDDVRFDTVPVKVDRIAVKEIPIRVAQTGSVNGKLVRTVPREETVTLTGAKSELDSVSYGEALADISEITADTVIEAAYILKDANDSLISSNETISAAKTRINIDCTVYDAIILPVRAVPAEDLQRDYEIDMDSISINPSSVEVGLKDMSIKEVLARVTDSEREEECELEEAEGMYIPESVKTVRVRADIAKIKTAEITLDVTAENLAQGLTANIGQVTVTVSGIEKDLTAENITAVVDLSGYAAGTYSVPVVIKGENVQITGSYNVNVTIS